MTFIHTLCVLIPNSQFNIEIQERRRYYYDFIAVFILLFLLCSKVVLFFIETFINKMGNKKSSNVFIYTARENNNNNLYKNTKWISWWWEWKGEVSHTISKTSSAFPLIIFPLIQLSPTCSIQQFLVFLRSFGRELAIVARAIQLNCCGKQKAPSSLSSCDVTRIRRDRIS